MCIPGANTKQPLPNGTYSVSLLTGQALSPYEGRLTPFVDNSRGLDYTR